MPAALVGFIVSLLADFVDNLLYSVIEFILMFQMLLPTDPFNGILDYSNELFMQWLPYINWFVPLDYAVLLFGSFLTAYSSYIIFLYLKKVTSSLFSGGSGLKLLSDLFTSG